MPQSSPAPFLCSICASPATLRVTSDRLTLFWCRPCRHYSAVHRETTLTQDYHAQYDCAGFLDSLRDTRLRQAKAISHYLLEVVGRNKNVLDIGAGRGWFLQRLHQDGFQRIAGVDTSPIAIQEIQRRGIRAFLCAPDHSMERIDFSPEVIALLDVVEHFPDPERVLRKLLNHYRNTLEYVVIKVPNSRGLLYQTAHMLQRARFSGPLEQLYQVGTHPPHYQYFSQRSLFRLAERLNLRLIYHWFDRDFEAASFPQRVRALSRLSWLGKIAGHMIAAVSESTGRADALIGVFAFSGGGSLRNGI